MKFLIDEDLSPRVSLVLCERYLVDAVHVRDRGMLGEPDQVVLERAFEEDRILVTANVGDFQRLAGARELHAGIVLVLCGDLMRSEQIELMGFVVELLQAEEEVQRDMINRVLEITSKEEYEFFELPPS